MQNFREIRPASIPTHAGGQNVEGAATQLATQQHQPALQPRDGHAEQHQPHHPHILPHGAVASPGFVAAGNTGHQLPIPPAAAIQQLQGPQRIESIVLPRRKRSVVQACRDCRKTKAKVCIFGVLFCSFSHGPLMLPPPTTPSLDPLPLLEHHLSRQFPFPHHIISSNSRPSRGLHTSHPSPVTRHHLPATALPVTLPTYRLPLTRYPSLSHSHPMSKVNDMPVSMSPLNVHG